MTRRQPHGKKQQRRHNPHHAGTPGAWSNAMASWPALTEAAQVTDSTGTPPKRLKAADRMRHHGHGDY